MLEFALAVVVFGLLTMGTIDFGRAVWTSSVVNHAVQESVRWAAMHSSESGAPATVESIREVLKTRAPFLNDDDLTVTAVWNPSNTPGAEVQVSAVYAFNPITPVLGGELLNLSSSASMSIVY